MLYPRTSCVGGWLEAVLPTHYRRSQPEGFVSSWDMAGTMMMTHKMMLFDTPPRADVVVEHWKVVVVKPLLSTGVTELALLLPDCC